MFTYRTYLGCLLLSLLIALWMTPLVGRLGRWLGAIDRPVNRKIHANIVPRFGGIALFLGLWAPLLSLCFYDNLVAQQVLANKQKLLLLFFGGFAMLLLGIVDDMRGLNARWKLAVQLPVAIALVAGGVQFDTIHFPVLGHIELGALGPLVSVLWLVGVTNALNIIDGIDGLASGVACLTSLTLALIALQADKVLLVVVILSMAGACLGFLRYNTDPAKIFLGDSGSLFIGMTLAVAAVLGSVKQSLGASLLVPAVLLGYPITDTLLSMVRRYVRGKPIFAGDASHIHHLLLYKGLDHRRVCLVIYSVCLACCLWSLAIARQHVPSIIIGAVVVFALAVAGVYYLGDLKNLRAGKLARDRGHFKAAYYFGGMVRAKLSIASTREEVVQLLRDSSEEFNLTAFEVNLLESPLSASSAFETGSRMKDPGEPSSNLHRDRYAFDATGLVVQVSASMEARTDELATERRRLFGEICVAANQRLTWMLQDAANKDLQIQIQSALKRDLRLDTTCTVGGLPARRKPANPLQEGMIVLRLGAGRVIKLAISAKPSRELPVDPVRTVRSGKVRR